jgi:hypothetical protein
MTSSLYGFNQYFHFVRKLYLGHIVLYQVAG